MRTLNACLRLGRENKKAQKRIPVLAHSAFKHRLCGFNKLCIIVFDSVKMLIQCTEAATVKRQLSHPIIKRNLWKSLNGTRGFQKTRT